MTVQFALRTAPAYSFVADSFIRLSWPSLACENWFQLDHKVILAAHFRKPNQVLQSLLADDRTPYHPMIVIEIACGTPPAPRERTLRDLKRLRLSAVATTDETLALIEKERFQDSGCGAVDMALLASVLLTPGAVLWTIDKRLHALAERLDVAFDGFIG